MRYIEWLVLFVIAVLGIFGIKTFTGAVSHNN